MSERIRRTLDEVRGEVEAIKRDAEKEIRLQDCREVVAFWMKHLSDDVREQIDEFEQELLARLIDKEKHRTFSQAETIYGPDHELPGAAASRLRV